MNRFALLLQGFAVWTLIAQSALVGASAEPGAPYRGPGTERMAKRLEQIAQNVNPMANRFLSRERMALLRPQVLGERDPKRRYELQGLLAMDTLNAGQSEQ